MCRPFFNCTYGLSKTEPVSISWSDTRRRDVIAGIAEWNHEVTRRGMSPGQGKRSQKLFRRLYRLIGLGSYTSNKRVTPKTKILMAKEEPPICTTCGTNLTVKHIISDCIKYNQERIKHGISHNLDAALGANHQLNEDLINFLKQTNMYNQI